MKKKHTVGIVIGVLVLSALALLQSRNWREFGWALFVSITKQVQFAQILSACALAYATYILRALRWQILLQPTRRVRAGSLIPAQFVGFTGLALLGRPGELVRPYLIARKHGLSISSQMAVWMVERIFDTGAFAALLFVDILIFSHKLPFGGELRKVGVVLAGIVLLMIAGTVLIRSHGNGIADWLAAKSASFSVKFASTARDRILAFGNGLHTVRDSVAFFQVTALSIGIWVVTGACYLLVLHSYTDVALQRIAAPQVLLLIGASMLGSLIQL